MLITGFINNPESTLQPLKGVAIVENGSVSGLSTNLLVKVSIEHASVLRSVKVTYIKISSSLVGDGISDKKIYDQNLGLFLGKIGNYLYFDTFITQAGHVVGNFSCQVTYRFNEEDLAVLQLRMNQGSNITDTTFSDIANLLKTLPSIYGEVYASPQDFRVAYTSSTTLTATGSSFDIDDVQCFIGEIDFKNSAGIWTKYINGHNGVSITSSSNVISIVGAGTPFAATDLIYRVIVAGQEKAYDTQTDTEKVTEQSPISNKYVQDSLVDATNTAATTTYFPSATGQSMDGFSALSLTGKLISTGQITMTLEVTNDEDLINANWVQVYGYENSIDGFVNIYNVPGNTTTLFAWSFNVLNFSNYRIKLIDLASVNTYIIKARKIY